MSQNLEARSRAEASLIRKAWADVEFKSELLSDAHSVYSQAISEAGNSLAEGTEVRVLEEQKDTLYLVIPSAPMEAAPELDDRSTRGEFEAALIHQAQADAEARAQLLADPRAAYEAQLAAVRDGAKLPEDLKIEAYEESDNVLYFRLPEAPTTGGQLSEEELEEVAGGKMQAAVAVGVAIASTVVVGAAVAAVLL